MNLKMFQESDHFNTFNDQGIYFSSSSESISKLCEECSACRPSIKCRECNALLCTVCSDKLHSSRVLKNHSKTLLDNSFEISIADSISSESGITEQNEIHDNWNVCELVTKCKDKQSKIRSSLLNAENTLRKIKADMEPTIRQMRTYTYDYFFFAQNLLNEMNMKIDRELRKIETSAEVSFETCKEKLNQLNSELEIITMELNEQNLPEVQLKVADLLKCSDKILLTNYQIQPMKYSTLENSKQRFKKCLEEAFVCGSGGEFSIVSEYEANHMGNPFVQKLNGNIHSNINSSPMSTINNNFSNRRSVSGQLLLDNQNKYSRKRSSNTLWNYNKRSFEELKEGRWYSNVTVSYIENPSDFWVQIPSHRRVLEQFEKTFSDILNWSSVSKNEVKTGSVFAVHKKNQWYRVKVLKIDTDNNVNVLMMDYGWNHSVNLFELRKINDDYVRNSIPLAFNCRLYLCYPIESPDWTEYVINQLKDIVKNNPNLSMKLHPNKKGKKLEIDLYTKFHDTSSSIRDILIATDRAQCLAPKEKAPVLTKPLLMRNFRKDDNFTKNEEVLVRVSHIESLQQFYVYRVNSLNEEIYEKMNKELNEFFKNNVRYKEHCISNIIEGMSVAAQYSKDNRWYRAVIRTVLKKSDFKRCQVFYVDFGNTEILGPCKIRAIPEKFTEIITRAVCCSLSNIEPTRKKCKEEIQYFAHFVKDEDLKMCIENIDDILLVSLLKKLSSYSQDYYSFDDFIIEQKSDMEVESSNAECQLSLNEQIVIEDCDMAFESNAEEIDPLKDGNSDNVVSSLTYRELLSVDSIDETLSKSDDGIIVSILSCIDPFTIYVQLTEQRNMTVELSGRMMKFYRDEGNNKMTALTSVNEQFKCAVYRESDGLWYRGKILSALEDDKFNVFLSDYATEETVSLKNIRNLSDEFKKVVDGCIRCSLHDFECRKEEFAYVCKKLKTLVDDCEEIRITPRGRINNNSLSVILSGKKIVCEDPLEPSKIDWVDIGKHLMEKIEIRRNQNLYKRPSKLIFENNLTEKLELEMIQKNSNELVQEWLASSSTDSVIEVTSHDVTFIEINEEEEFEVEMDSSIIGKNWLPAIPLKEKMYKCVPTYVDFDMSIYVHICGNNALKELNRNLQSRYKNTVSSYGDIYSWKIGEMCIVLFDLDENWYRGCIRKIDMEEGRLAVEFVDYGNLAYVTPSKVRKDVDFEFIPIQCYKLSLPSDLIPIDGEKWTYEQIEFVQRTIADRECEIEIIKEKEENIHRIKTFILVDSKVDLYDLLRNVNKYSKLLINSNQLENISIKDEHENNSDGSSESEICSVDLVENMDNTPIIHLKDLLNEKKLIYCTMSNIKQSTNNDTLLEITEIQPPNEMVSVKITEILTKNIIVVNILDNPTNTMIKEMRTKFDSMEMELQNCAFKQPLITSPCEGQVCCTTFVDDGKWYRVIIIGKNVGDNFFVYYIDYGNTESVKSNNLHCLKPEWHRIPAQALKCNIESEMEVRLESKYNAFIQTNFRKHENDLKHSIRLHQQL